MSFARHQRFRSDRTVVSGRPGRNSRSSHQRPHGRGHARHMLKYDSIKGATGRGESGEGATWWTPASGLRERARPSSWSSSATAVVEATVTSRTATAWRALDRARSVIISAPAKTPTPHRARVTTRLPGRHAQDRSNAPARPLPCDGGQGLRELLHHSGGCNLHAYQRPGPLESRTRICAAARAAVSMIPTSTGAAKAIARCPEPQRDD